MLREEHFNLATYLPGRPHGVEGGGHELGCSCPVLIIGGFRLEKFRVRQQDPQLIVQPVKEQTQVDRVVHHPQSGA